MKFFTTIALLLSLLVHTYAQTFNDPGSYMTFISDQYREIMKDHLSYTSAVSHGKSARKVENRRLSLLQTSKDVRKKVAALPPYKGDKSLRDSTIAFLDISYHLLNDDYGKIVNMEEIAEQSYDAMEAYLMAQDVAHDKINEAGNRLEATTHAFADKYKVKLIESSDKLSKKAAEATRVNRYYRIVYLIFFKSYKQEMYLLDAMEKKDINSIEQNKNTLLKDAQDGLSKLQKVQPFDGDASLMTACKQLLEFHKKEAQEKMPLITDYYLKQENFDKIKKAFDAKPEKDRTKADVDQFNNAVKEINAGVNAYNNNNNFLNQNRGMFIDNWNKSSSKFLDKHVPKY